MIPEGKTEMQKRMKSRATDENRCERLLTATQQSGKG
jgi:hypothetical protein